jgi:hypothetical protein
MGILVLTMDTSLNALEPFVLQDLIDSDSSLWVRIQDPLHQLTASHRQFLKGLIVVDSTHLQEMLKVGILSGGRTEWDALVDHAVIDDTTSPHIHTTSIVFLGLEFFGSNVRLRTTETLGQVRCLFPAHPEYVRDTKIGDLEATLPIEKQVLGLDIPVSDSHRVQVGDTVDELLEATVHLHTGHIPLFDGIVQITTTAVFLIIRNAIGNKTDNGIRV